MVITRKLKEVSETLDSIITQNDLAKFLNDTGNAEMLNGLVEDIRVVLMQYQVCTPEPLVCIASKSTPDLITARYL
jgi:hypothetical protein